MTSGERKKKIFLFASGFVQEIQIGIVITTNNDEFSFKNTSQWFEIRPKTVQKEKYSKYTQYYKFSMFLKKKNIVKHLLQRKKYFRSQKQWLDLIKNIDNYC